MTKTKHYPDPDPNPDFPKIEETVLEFWKREQLFQESVNARPAKDAGKNNEFIFYDGPPFANGLPHYGHLLTGFVKDVFARYQTMKGKRVERRFGWDCHGLPAEMGSEKELSISGRQAIIKYGIDKFNEHCRTSVMKYTHEWEYYVTRQARWVDFKNDYKTMDKNFMESVLWAFKQLYEKGLIYEAYRVMPYSWAAETPLSNFETKLDNSYRERTDKAITVAFELNTPPKGAPKADKYYVLAWTTTPWTLPSNLALAVNKEMDYVCVTVDSPPLEGGRAHEVSRGGQAEGYTAEAKTHAQEMRKELTPAEFKLWSVLAKKQLEGYKFRRQQPIGPYIADFYQAEAKLIVEVDGGQHNDDSHVANDAKRTTFFEKQGYRVLRFWNNEVTENIEGVTTRILEAVKNAPPGSSREEPAPPQGGGYKVCYVLADNALGQYRKIFGILDPADPDYQRFPGGVGKDGKPLLDEIRNYAQEKAKALDESEKLTSESFKGSNLIGLSYHPLFPYFANHKHSFKILDGSTFVTDGDGTGIVHMAPGFGEEDQKVSEANGIEVVVPVDGQGKFTDEIFDLTDPPLSLKGLNVIAQETGANADEPYKPDQLKRYGLANLRIINWLKQTGKLIAQDDYKHSYPHCWRTDTPLIYRAMPSWYVEVTKFRDRAVELNKQINWIPDHVRDGQMGHMLATAPDWSISRNRFWGTPIPVWRSKSGKIKVFGSIAELEKASGQKIDDLHRPYIDNIVIKGGAEEYHRVEDVFDCWFESGSMPFAQVHYPFENKDWFETHFPADFITEYVGQTRGWFNTLIMLSTALFDKPPFKNCICHGVVLDAETGLKYSKRLKNYKDPKEVMDQFGADALRWLMMSSPVMRGADLAVDPDGKFIRDVVRLAIKPIWNAYNFFCLYANADGVKAKLATDSKDMMDRYILQKCVQEIQIIDATLYDYDTPAACEAIGDFFDALNNWYIRRSKPRFWKEEMDADKQAAYDTLYTVLTAMCTAAAPLLPMITEEIYKGLTGERSVHLVDSPIRWATKTANTQFVDFTDVVDGMEYVRNACTAALSVRNAKNIRVRQPLTALTLVMQGGDGSKKHVFSAEQMELVKDEVNVKTVSVELGWEKYATLKLSLNNPILGKRLPEKMKQIIPASKKGEWKLVKGKVEVCGEVLQEGEYTLNLEPKPEYKDRAQPLSTNDALVILDLTITPELEAEGIARDVVRMIQQARKDSGLDVSDRIHIGLEAEEGIQKAIATHKDYIAGQTLAVDIASGKIAGGRQFENELEGKKLTIGIRKAA